MRALVSGMLALCDNIGAQATQLQAQTARLDAIDGRQVKLEQKVDVQLNAFEQRMEKRMLDHRCEIQQEVEAQLKCTMVPPPAAVAANGSGAGASGAGAGAFFRRVAGLAAATGASVFLRRGNFLPLSLALISS